MNNDYSNENESYDPYSSIYDGSDSSNDYMTYGSEEYQNRMANRMENSMFDAMEMQRGAVKEGVIYKTTPAARPRAVSEDLLAQSFIFMAIALIVTSISAMVTLNSPNLMYHLFTGNTFYILLLAEIGIVLISNFTISKNMVVPSAVLFTLYAVINGITLSVIFLVYTAASILGCFISAAVMFAVMAVYGLTTKRDLTTMGSYLIMGLVGIIIAGVVNMFLGNSTLEIIISAVGCILFIGLTAYDVQKIKNMAAYAPIENTTTLALMGAMEIYLDFINLFLKLLRLFGKRR